MLNSLTWLLETADDKHFPQCKSFTEQYWAISLTHFDRSRSYKLMPSLIKTQKPKGYKDAIDLTL